MLTINAKRSTLLVVDFQERLLPAIDQGEAAIANTGHLLKAAAILNIPTLFTEQNARGLGGTVAALADYVDAVVHKMTFDAVRVPSFLDATTPGHAFVVTGCEAHVCVCQTVLGLLAANRQVYIVRDAMGSRRAESKETAIRRMERHGAETVTTEMVLFEWLDSAEHPRFREVLGLIK